MLQDVYRDSPIEKEILLAMSQRLHFAETPPKSIENDLPCAVLAGLSAPVKTLPSRLFYDVYGSALFEEITALPEYYLTRTEANLLQQYASAIVAALQTEIAVVEFGSGSSAKTRLLFDAILKRQSTLHYTAIDISREFLSDSARALLQEYSQLNITAIPSEYHVAMNLLPAESLPRLFLFLGSNLGNFETAEAVTFLHQMRSVMQPNDRILLGVDLVKNRQTLEAAYNDAQGITAAFNKNLLMRINRELDADFDLACFAHLAFFHAEQSRIEMHLVSKREQTVFLGALGRTVAFREGETIHTENSTKYTQASIAFLCEQAGLAVQELWTDGGQGFAAALIRPIEFKRGEAAA